MSKDLRALLQALLPQPANDNKPAVVDARPRPIRPPKPKPPVRMHRALRPRRRS